MKKFSVLLVLLILAAGIYSPSTKAAVYENTFCKQFKGVKSIWWDGMELKPGQIGRLNVEKDTSLFKLNGDKKVFERTLKAGEFYRIYAFKPGMLSVGGGFYVDRDSKVTYQTPSKAKLQAVQCISNPYGTRKNPTALGDAWNVETTDNWDGYKKYQISVTEVIDGDHAWELIHEENMFNDAPPPGMKYLMVKFKVKLFKSDSEPFNVNKLDFDAVSKAGVVYETQSVVLPDELWTDLYDGGETEGWTSFLVNINDNPLIVWNREYQDELWFKVR